jgi:CheY-like chemotaxis protein
VQPSRDIHSHSDGLLSNSALPAQEKVDILIVDEQDGKLVTYEAILAELGENLIKAHGPNEALRCLLTTDIAVVLLDVNMPGVDGFQLAEMIRHHPRFRDTAIIFVSAIHLTDLHRLKGYEHGGVDGRHARMIADVVAVKLGPPDFTWGAGKDLVAEGDARTASSLRPAPTKTTGAPSRLCTLITPARCPQFNSRRTKRFRFAV